MARGGSRYGAGRPAYKGKAEACLRLDVREWARRGLLRSGYSSSWAWTNTATGERSGSIGFSVGESAVMLTYSLDGDAKRQHVPILRTGCNYGGSRPWFACPHCRRRVAVLYLRRGGFYCRRCAQVAYYSQSDDECGRAWRRQQKAEAKLGDGWSRPKGMHRKTRARLLATIWECEETRDRAIDQFMARFQWRLSRA